MGSASETRFWRLANKASREMGIKRGDSRFYPKYNRVRRCNKPEPHAAHRVVFSIPGRDDDPAHWFYDECPGRKTYKRRR